MLILGLTGSIGMGKSATAEIFRSCGAPVHDSDRAVHDLYRGEERTMIGAEFPAALTADGIDRAILREQVLHDPAAMARLEAIVHPLVCAHRARFLAHWRARGARLAVCDIPLLFETGAQTSMDIVVLVSASEEVQKSRVLARPGMTQDRFDAIMARQMPDSEKRRRAHAIIDTGRGHAEARAQVVHLLRTLAGVSGRVIETP